MEITETVVLPSFVTNAFVLSGVKAMSFGLVPTGMLATIWFVAVLITVTWLSAKFVAKAKRPSGVILIPYIDRSGIGMVVTVSWVALSMTHTFPVPPSMLNLVRYVNRPSGVTAVPGLTPTSLSLGVARIALLEGL